MFVADLTVTALSGPDTPKIVPYRVYAPNGTLTSVGLPVLGLMVVTIRQTDGAIGTTTIARSCILALHACDTA